MSSAKSQADTGLDQNWSPAQVRHWYEDSQGSRLAPLAWAEALEVAGGEEPFLSDAHMSRLGYLPRTRSDGRRLPVGFAVDSTPDSQLGYSALRWRQGQPQGVAWLGLTCAACHTAEITHDGKAYRIEGGPALADFQTLLVDLRASLTATQAEPARFDRFAARVLKRDDNPRNRELLRAAMKKVTDHELALARLNDTPLAYGRGRLDAFGHIYNKVAFSVAGAQAPPQPADAPVSYPFLWNIPQHERVQWNGIAKNRPLPTAQTFDVGALGRNTGEVIGVFGDISPRAGKLQGYPSSVNVRNLVAFEQQLETLKPPAWPKAFGWDKDHTALVGRGETLFKAHCAGCHQDLDRSDLKTRIPARMAMFRDANPPGTDIWMACNAYVRAAPSGVLQGTPQAFFSGAPLEDEAFLSDLLTATVAGAMYDKKGELVKTAAASVFGVNRPSGPPVAPVAGQTLKEQQAQRCLTETSEILGYRARPLNGIWATGPYLHNGSVPTLYDLLLPEDRRPTSFRVGTREFDPVKVGYRTDVAAPGNSFEFHVNDPSGRPIAGNSNRGHTYAVEALADDRDRWALVEYLKTR